ncbi:hypothetical protein RM697_05175 [Ichthyenterobacterium sp. W332]|uniref:Glycerophosphodiester phosphodiesterase n=1 Tax=Microcosmobacter mediterraneus TaxID=3075607 RepID=A0ABU2YIM2_9FLAO|nr:hypothetical protein [Ichthyenterobacterium sp. W332]MDT0558024.1 hypothetical protein [Ichthyenterobacterium sp. W332]
MTLNHSNKKKLITFNRIGKLFFVFALLVFAYSYSPYKLEFLGHYDKIWAHRTNDSGRLNSALNYYPGVEVDLTYNEIDDYLDVNHPYQTSVGLTFKDLINSIKSPLNLKGLWLDLKNLSETNQDIILKKITSALKQKDIDHGVVLIESPNPSLLQKFSDAGFKVSYYLPKELYKKTDSELLSEISKITEMLKNFPELPISTSHDDYEIIHKHFPKKDKYIWALVWTLNLDYFEVKRVLNDPKVRVVLVNYKTLKGNR